MWIETLDDDIINLSKCFRIGTRPNRENSWDLYAVRINENHPDEHIDLNTYSEERYAQDALEDLMVKLNNQ
jgi:hypothetical protein